MSVTETLLTTKEWGEM